MAGAAQSLALRALPSAAHRLPNTAITTTCGSRAAGTPSSITPPADSTALAAQTVPMPQVRHVLGDGLISQTCVTRVTTRSTWRAFWSTQALRDGTLA